jgi:hypothetical protein
MFQAAPGKFRRLSRRWVLPVAGVTMGLAAIALLVVQPTDPAPRGRSGRPIGWTLPAMPAVAVSSPSAATPQRLETPRAGAAPRALAPNPQLAETLPGAPVALAASTDSLREIESATDLLARLRIVDRLMLEQPPDDVAALIEKLMDHPPGRSDEARALRIALLGRLGVLPAGGRADQRLCQALEPDQPRPERLSAIEALVHGGFHPLGRSSLQKIADSDPDGDVRKKAQWALAQPE